MDHTLRAPDHVPMERSSRSLGDQFPGADYEPNLSLSSLTNLWFDDTPAAGTMDWTSFCFMPTSLTSMYGFGAGTAESSSPVQNSWTPWVLDRNWPWPSPRPLVDNDTLETPYHALTSHSPSSMDESMPSPFIPSYTDDASHIWGLAGLENPAIDDQVLIRGSHPPIGGLNFGPTSEAPLSDFDFPMAAGPSTASPLLSSWPGAFHFYSGVESGGGESTQSRPQREMTRGLGRGGGLEDRMDLDNGTRAVQGQTPIRLEHQNTQARPAVHTAAPTRVRSPISASKEWWDRQRRPDGLYHCPAVDCGSPAFRSCVAFDRHAMEVHRDFRDLHLRCPIEGCVRGQSPFRRRWNLADHLKSVHNIDKITPPSAVPDQPTRVRIQSMPEPPSEPQPARRPRRRRSVGLQGSRNETSSHSFSCPMPDCNATFRREWNVENHLVTVHDIDGPRPPRPVSPPAPTRTQQPAQTSGRSRRSALLIAELDRQLATFRPTPNATTTTTTATAPAKPEPPKAKRKSVHDDTECPICCELLWNGEDERLSWCKAQCGQNFHAACWGIWEKEQKRRAKKAKCAMCRTEWVG